MKRRSFFGLFTLPFIAPVKIEPFNWEKDEINIIASTVACSGRLPDSNYKLNTVYNEENIT